MKVLSLWQPWATLMVLPEKRIETRHWNLHHRGPLLIHAAKRFTYHEKDLCDFDFFRQSLAAHGFGKHNMPLGAIIGQVNVVGCVQMTEEWISSVDCKERAFGNYCIGRYGIITDSPVLFDAPIPARGFQGLWDYDLPEDLRVREFPKIFKAHTHV